MTEPLPQLITRVRHGACVVPRATSPHDTVHYRIFHPATFTGAEIERQTGALPPDTSTAPWPVLIMLGGINVNPDGYRWLASRLTGAGIAAVLFQFVGEVTPGDVGLTPGLDLTALTPETWGTRPSATTIGPLLDALRHDNASGPLQGCLDLDRVVLAGHSAGGTIALLNTNPDWFGARAVVSYAGHTMPAALLGHPASTVLPVFPGVPALILGGAEDAVIAASATRYRSDANPSPAVDNHHPVTATFDTAAATPKSTLAILRNGTHLTLCDPVDTTTARGFLEEPDTNGDEHRTLLVDLITAFLADVLDLPVTTTPLERLGTSPLLSEFRR